MQEQKLLASDGQAGDLFGHSVAVSGDVAVIGADWDDDRGFDSGSAYVFRFNGSSWTQEQKLLASDGQTADAFGHSVAVSGNVAVIGAWGDDDRGTDAGAAYVLRWTGSSWTQEQKLLATDAQANDVFGLAVAVTGDVAVVGAPWDNDRGDSAGSAHVYRSNGASWGQEAKLLASDGQAGDYFGMCVAASGNIAVIGAYWDDELGSFSGSAYLFRWNDASWVQEAKLLASDGQADDEFGVSVAVSGDVAVIGADRNDGRGTDSGAAYIYDLGCGCAADFNGDGEVDTRDVLAFLNAWASGDPASDCDVNGAIDTRDVLCFLNLWTAGC